MIVAMGLFDGISTVKTNVPAADHIETAKAGMEVAERQLEARAAFQPILTPQGVELLRRAREQRPLDEAAKAAFLEALQEVPSEHRAALSAGVTILEARKAKREDGAFAEAWDSALHLAVGYAEEEAFRRAVRGVPKGIYYQGMKVDTENQYSDQLLGRILEANEPRYERKSQVKADVTANVNWLELVRAVRDPENSK